MLVVIGTYAFHKIKMTELTGMVEITEIISYFRKLKDFACVFHLNCFLVSALRATVYIIFMLLLSERVRSTANQIIRNREEAAITHPSLTLRYKKQELRASNFFIASSLMGVILFFSVVLFQKNEYALPLKFYIVYLPFQETTTNWLINYIYQMIVAFVTAPCLIIFFTLTWVMMNQCCWEWDMLIEDIKAFSDDSEFKKIVERSVKAINFQKEVQTLLQFNFTIEFAILSTIFCLALYSIALDPFGSFMGYAIIQMILFQLFITCWIGDRFSERVSALTTAIYNVEWYTMKASRKKELVMILRWSQDLRGFRGVFNRVNMETMQKVR